MKRKKLFIPVTVFALLLSVGLGACGGNSNNNEGGGGDSSGAPASNSTSAQQPRITVTAAESKNKLLKKDVLKICPQEQKDIQAYGWTVWRDHLWEIAHQQPTINSQ